MQFLLFLIQEMIPDLKSEMVYLGGMKPLRCRQVKVGECWNPQRQRSQLQRYLLCHCLYPHDQGNRKHFIFSVSSMKQCCPSQTQTWQLIDSIEKVNKTKETQGVILMKKTSKICFPPNDWDLMYCKSGREGDSFINLQPVLPPKLNIYKW